MIAAALVAVMALPAAAQNGTPEELPPKSGPMTPAPDKPEWVKPPAKLPHVAGEPTKNLDFLFGALKAAPDTSIAKAVEERIWAVWAVSRSDTTNLLMVRARTAIEQKDSDLAAGVSSSEYALVVSVLERIAANLGWHAPAAVS